eukprot:gene15768-11288_t
MSSRWSLSTSFFQNRQTQSNQQLITAYTEDDLQHLKTLRVISNLPCAMCWIEKFLLVVDYFQIFGIIWNASQPWPWPYQWVYLTQTLNYVNFDFFSVSSEGALLGRSRSITIPPWGRYSGYLYYAFAFAVIAGFLTATFAVLRQPTDRYGKLNFPYRTQILALFGLVMYIAYNPLCLALVRLFYCEDWQDEPFVLSADPHIKCLSVSHVVITFISCLLALPMIIGVPVILHRYVAQNSVYHDRRDHEKRLQVWELLYMLQLDPYWLDGYVWLTSSFTRFGAFYYLHLLAMKLLLLLVFVAVRSSYIAQAWLMTIIVCVFAGYYTVYRRPFRSYSSNVMFVVLCALWVFELFFALANANGVRNAVVVASTESIILIVVNALGFGVIAVVVGYDATVPTVTDWPAMRTIQRIWTHRDALPKVAHWIESYRESQHILHDFLLAPVEVADVPALEASIRRLRSCWLQARSTGSIFDTALSELLETLLLVHSSRYLFAYRKHAHWDQAYQAGVAARVFDRRASFVQLMNPKKRSLLQRLLAYRTVRGDHIHAGKFDLELARKYEGHLKFQEELRQRKRHRGGAGGDPGDDAAAHHEASKSLYEQQRLLFLHHLKKQQALAAATGGSSTATTAAAAAAVSAAADGAAAGGSAAEAAAIAAVASHQNLSPAAIQAAVQAAATGGVLSSAPSFTGHSFTGTAAAGFTQSFFNRHGLNKVNTMDLMKQTADEDEIQDMEDLFHLWDEAILLYEQEEFPGDYELLNRQVENWYTYRNLVSQRLETIGQPKQSAYSPQAQRRGGGGSGSGDQDDAGGDRGALTPPRAKKERHLKGWGVKSSATSPVPTTATGASPMRRQYPNEDDDGDLVNMGSPARGVAGGALFARDVGGVHDDDDDMAQLLANPGVWDEDDDAGGGADEETGLLSPAERDRYRIRK